MFPAALSLSSVILLWTLVHQYWTGSTGYWAKYYTPIHVPGIPFRFESGNRYIYVWICIGILCMFDFESALANETYLVCIPLP